MARIIKYKTTCFYCKKICDPQEEKELLKLGKIKHLSFLHRTNGTWWAHCGECYELNKIKKAEEIARIRNYYDTN